MAHSSFKKAAIICLDESGLLDQIEEEARSAGFQVETLEVEQISTIDISKYDLVCFMCKLPGNESLLKGATHTCNAKIIVANEGLPEGECIVVLKTHFSAQPRARVYTELWQ